MEIFHSIDITLSLLMGVGWGAGASFPDVQSFSTSWTSSTKFASLVKSMTFMRSGKSTGSAIAAQGPAAQLVVGW